MVIQLICKVAGGIVRFDRQRVVMILGLVTRDGDIYGRVSAEKLCLVSQDFMYLL